MTDFLMQWTEHQLIESSMFFGWEVGGAVRRGGAVATVLYDDRNGDLHTLVPKTTDADYAAHGVWGGPYETVKRVLILESKDRIVKYTFEQIKKVQPAPILWVLCLVVRGVEVKVKAKPAPVARRLARSVDCQNPIWQIQMNEDRAALAACGIAAEPEGAWRDTAVH